MIRKKFGPLRPKEERIRTVVVQSNVVNGYTHNISAERAIICPPTATINLMDGAEAELAFIMGHKSAMCWTRPAKPYKRKLERRMQKFRYS